MTDSYRTALRFDVSMYDTHFGQASALYVYAATRRRRKSRGWRKHVRLMKSQQK